MKKEDAEELKKRRRNQETDFNSAEIDTAHFDAVNCERFVVESHRFLKAQESKNPAIITTASCKAFWKMNYKETRLRLLYYK